LPKFTKTKEDQLENIVEKWCYFFRYAAETNEEDLDKIVGSDVIIKRAYEEMNKFNWSEEELLAYEQMKKRIMDEVAALAQKFDEGLKVGHEKGRQEEKIEVAKNSLKAGVSIDVIAQITGLSHSEILQLKEKT
ncbi:MAG: Rpn family recombination-promoting nuclease/putative transposase, partial [Wolbachia sp.]